jgi:hypothetical protein
MPERAPRTRWAKLCAGLVIAAFEFVSDCLHPEITEILVIASVAIPVIMTAALLVIITRSDEQTCERVFRLLRWMVNRPEPPSTQAAAPARPSLPAAATCAPGIPPASRR